LLEEELLELDWLLRLDGEDADERLEGDERLDLLDGEDADEALEIDDFDDGLLAEEGLSGMASARKNGCRKKGSGGSTALSNDLSIIFP